MQSSLHEQVDCGFRRLAADRRAVAALEFALVLPVLLIVIFGTISAGLAISYAHEVQELASAVARASVAGQSDTERSLLAQTYVSHALSSSALLRSSNVTVKTGSVGTPPNAYVVTIRYALTGTPIPAFAQFVGLSIASVGATATVAFGGY